MQTPPIDVYNSEGEILDIFESTVEFKEVDFAYPTRQDIPVLAGFSLKVASSQTVALVGASGCGKSTIISLIERFYDPQRGKVLLENEKFFELKSKEYRDGIKRKETR